MTEINTTTTNVVYTTKVDAQALLAPTVIPEAIERMADERYKVVPSHESMFHRWAVVAGTGAQQLYLGREVECQNMARKFAGAFLDGAFAYHSMTAAPQPSYTAQAPAGWKLVPVEPTDDMLRAIRNQRSGGRVGAGDRADWAAWLAAAPTPAAQADSVQEDAMRYRWLREGNDAKHGAAWHVAVNLYGCEWDAAIDAAMNKGATP